MVCVTHYVVAGVPALPQYQFSSHYPHVPCCCGLCIGITAGRASPGLLLRCGSGQTSR